MTSNVTNVSNVAVAVVVPGKPVITTNNGENGENEPNTAVNHANGQVDDDESIGDGPQTWPYAHVENETTIDSKTNTTK